VSLEGTILVRSGPRAHHATDILPYLFNKFKYIFPPGWASLRRGAGTWAELLLSTMTVLQSTTTHTSQSPRTHAYQNQNTTIHVYHEGSQKGVAAAQEFLAGWPQHSRLHGSVDQPWGREVKVDGSRPIVRRKSDGGSE
jgi:hypothetical protein